MAKGFDVDHPRKHPIRGELPEENRHALASHTIGGFRRVGKEKRTTRGLIHLKNAIGFKVGQPSVGVVANGKRSFLPFLGLPHQTNGQPTVKLKRRKCFEKQRVDPCTQGHTKGFLVHGCTRLDRPRRLVFSKHFDHDVVFVGSRHEQPVRGHAFERSDGMGHHRIQPQAKSFIQRICTTAEFAGSVVNVRILVVVACTHVHATMHLQRVAHAIAVVVLKAIAVAVVTQCRVLATAVLHVGVGLVIARFWVKTPLDCEHDGQRLDKRRRIATRIFGSNRPCEHLHQPIVADFFFLQALREIEVAIVNHKRLKHRNGLAQSLVDLHERFVGIHNVRGDGVHHRDHQGIKPHVACCIRGLVNPRTRVTLQAGEREPKRSVTHPLNLNRAATVRSLRHRVENAWHGFVASNGVVCREMGPVWQSHVHAWVLVVANAINVHVVHATAVVDVRIGVEVASHRIGASQHLRQPKRSSAIECH